MGSLGDKFKKLAGDQTRQLLQNFQNAQSSKTRNGYSYGKLNEDGTATLADGTTVQVEVKGRPGQYAPVFNLGNGQGLVDQPEAKFFNIDSSGILRYYGVFVTIEQQYPNSFYDDQDVLPSGRLYFNYFTAVNIQLVDLINEKVYDFDPNLFSGIQDLPLPHRQVRSVYPPGNPQAYVDSVFTGGPLSRIFDAQDPNSRMSYAYSNVRVQIGAEGKDILIYQISNSINEGTGQSYITHGASPTFDLISNTVESVGAPFFKYWILKDYYFEGSTLKCDNVIEGEYVGIQAPPLVLLSESSYANSGIGYSSTYTLTDILYVPSLNRNVSGEVELNLLVQIQTNQRTESTIFHPGDLGLTNSTFSGTRRLYGGYTSYMVKDIASNPTTTWESTVTSDGPYPRYPLGYSTVYYESYRGSLYGTLQSYTPPYIYEIFRCNFSTLAPDTLIPAEFPSATTGYISKDFFYSYSEYVPGILESLNLPSYTIVRSPIYGNLGLFNSEVYFQQPPPFWDPMRDSGQYPQSTALHYTENSWISAIPSIPFGPFSKYSALQFVKVTPAINNTLQAVLFPSRYDIPEGRIESYTPEKPVYSIPGVVFPDYNDVTYIYPWAPTSFMAFQS